MTQKPIPALTVMLTAIAILLAGCASPPADREGAKQSELQPHSRRYPDAYPAIALSGLVDPKDWADAVPRAPADEINRVWKMETPQTNEALSRFIETWFDLPDEVRTDDAIDLGDTPTLSAHIGALWPQLTRQADEGVEAGSLIPLPNPYIVPGGRFREVYYWDAYFTMTGMGLEHDAIKRDMVDNFAWQIARFGHVPNANRTYYLSRSQPPFFFAMVGLLSPGDKPAAWAAYLDALKAEHAFWMAGERSVELPHGAILNRYWDARTVPRDESFIQDSETAEGAARERAELFRDLRAGAESGWDFSSRWLTDPQDLSTIRTTRILPADLNALLYGLEQAIAAGCERAGDAPCAEKFNEAAKARQTAMRRYLWDAEMGAFADYDLDTGASTGRVSAASIYPLYFGLASAQEATSTARLVEQALLKPQGLAATPLKTGQQWDAPNGWAPLHWLAVIGLERYGEDALAREIARRWLETVSRAYCESGKLVEKYDVVTARPGGGGEYPTQDGFGWTNGVTMALLAHYPDFAAYGEIRPRLQAPESCAAQ
ncbi:MAG: alpha,alpha-trehalase TreF [Henriciella sp.]|uniref:alpha,alpha-trehalase TreF n=1 Tax=Henriciella sp. TaxID=1968823 RepID=UPI003C72B2ED